MGFFGDAHGCEWKTKRPPIPKICQTYPTMMKLGRAKKKKKDPKEI